MMKEPGSSLKNPNGTRSSIKVGIRRRKPAGAGGGLDYINYSERRRRKRRGNTRTV